MTESSESDSSSFCEAHLQGTIPKAHRRYVLILCILLFIWAGLLAIAPFDRATWALENALAIIGILVLVLTYRRFQFSRLSYTLIFAFTCLHEVGSHYTYSEVPYNQWSTAISGTSINEIFGWERNHFDRLIHFLYGFLLAYPVREIFLRIADVRGFWGYALPMGFTMSTSLVYEQIEWGAAVVFGGELGMAYLGTQGDIWDSHKDGLLATIGALLSMGLTAAINLWLQRDFTSDWIESIRVKRHEPLGEVAIKRMLKENDESS